MSDQLPEEALIRNHYQTALDYELERLEKHCPVELGLTLRCLRRYSPSPSVVLDVGVGAGLYAEHFAKAGAELFLADISQELLEATTRRLKDAGLSSQVRAVHQASATDLAVIPSMIADAAMFLGPFYHLRAAADRVRAAKEAARVLKSGGIFFAAALNRIAFLRDHFRNGPERILQNKAFCLEFLKHGNTDPSVTGPLGFAHFSTVEEVRELFQEDFVELAVIGTEAFTSPSQHILASQPDDVRESWLDLVDAVSTSTEGQSYSDHLLYIARRR